MRRRKTLSLNWNRSDVLINDKKKIGKGKNVNGLEIKSKVKSMIKNSAKNLCSRVGMEDFVYQEEKRIALGLGWNGIGLRMGWHWI